MNIYTADLNIALAFIEAGFYVLPMIFGLYWALVLWAKIRPVVTTEEMILDNLANWSRVFQQFMGELTPMEQLAVEFNVPLISSTPTSTQADYRHQQWCNEAQIESCEEYYCDDHPIDQDVLHPVLEGNDRDQERYDAWAFNHEKADDRECVLQAIEMNSRGFERNEAKGNHQEADLYLWDAMVDMKALLNGEGEEEAEEQIDYDDQEEDEVSECPCGECWVCRMQDDEAWYSSYLTKQKERQERAWALAFEDHSYDDVPF